MARAQWSIKSGDKFSRLEAVRFIRRGAQSVQYWEFKCECGTRHVTVAAQVKDGRIKSCGCLRHEKQIAPRAGKHKMIHAAEYKVWSSMRARCRCKDDRRYGGRGITVCARWSDFSAFYADMGPRPSPSHSIDRIDNDGSYQPSNCRWATKKEQAINRRNTIFVIVDGQRMLLSEASAALSVNYRTLHWRVRNNRPLANAL